MNPAEWVAAAPRQLKVIVMHSRRQKSASMCPGYLYAIKSSNTDFGHVWLVHASLQLQL